MDEPQAQAEAGWYDDPDVRGTKRYWDGEAWTDHTADGYDDEPEPDPRRGDPYRPHQHSYVSKGRGTFYEANQQSLFALGFAAGYLVLAITTGFHVLGIFPAFSAYQAFQRREPLAPFAVVIAIVVILAGVGVSVG